MTGEVIQLEISKGFGFIHSREAGGKVFFHVRQLVGLAFDDSLYGRRVEFGIEKTDKGLKATQVQAAE